MSHLDGFCGPVKTMVESIVGQKVRVATRGNRILFSWRDPSHKKDAPRIERFVEFDSRRGVERDEVLARVREAV